MTRSLNARPGWINREFAALRKDIRELRAEKRLARSSFTDVPVGSIPTAALSNPNVPGFVNQLASNFPVLAAGSFLIDVNVAVPDGFNSCVVSLTARVLAYNTNAAPDYLYARPVVSGAMGTAMPVPVDVAGSAGEAALNVAPMVMVLTDLDPTFQLQLWAGSLNADWAATALNTADIVGSLTWFN